MGSARSRNRPARRPAPRATLTARVVRDLGGRPRWTCSTVNGPASHWTTPATAVLFPAPSPPTSATTAPPPTRRLPTFLRTRRPPRSPRDPAPHAQDGVLAPGPPGARVQGPDEPVGGTHALDARAAGLERPAARRPHVDQEGQVGRDDRLDPLPVGAALQPLQLPLLAGRQAPAPLELGVPGRVLEHHPQHQHGELVLRGGHGEQHVLGTRGRGTPPRSAARSSWSCHPRGRAGSARGRVPGVRSVGRARSSGARPGPREPAAARLP